MNNGVITNAEELKKLYIETDLLDSLSIQATVKEIKENVYVDGKEKYIEALGNTTPSNLSKAIKYNSILAFGGYKTTIFKNIGWIFAALTMLIIMIAYPDWEDDAPDWTYLLVWVGLGIQIYTAVLKSAWRKLTLDGTIIHPILKNKKGA